MQYRILIAELLLVSFVLAAPALRAGDAEVARQVSFEPEPGARVPAALEFTAPGGAVSLGELVAGKPTLLTFAWFDCPNLCGLVLNSLADTLARLEPAEREAWQVIVVSMDPAADPAVLTAAAGSLGGRYPDAGVREHWHFLTGSGEAIARLAAATGFGFVYDEKKQQFAHPAGIVALDREGAVRGAVAGVNFGAEELRGLRTASREAARASLNPVLLLCYDYDPASGRYSLAIMRLLRVAGLLFIAAGAWFYWRWYRRQGAT